MYQIDTVIAVSTQPTPADPGTPGWFTDGDHATNQPATQANADWLNMVQGEMGAILASAGISQSKGDNAQVIQSLLLLIQQQGVLVAHAGGTADAITAGFTPAITAPIDGQRVLVRAAYANATTTPTFTPNSGTITPLTIVKGNDLPLSPGDIAGAGQWLELIYDTALTKWVLQNPSSSVIVPRLQLGQCRLRFTSTTTLTLSRYNGSYLMIDGMNYQIPSAGITLGSSGLSVSTLYYVYAYMDSGVMTLEASTTGHELDPDTGVEIMSNDSSRSLVGMCYLLTPGEFALNLVLSWFNRGTVLNETSFSAHRSTSSSSFVEVNSEIRNYFLTWGSTSASIEVYGEMSIIGGTSAPASGLTAVGIDNSTPVDPIFIGSSALTNVTQSTGVAIRNTNKTLSEGIHYATILGAVQSGIGALAGWYAGLSTGQSVMTKLVLRTEASG